MNANEESRLPPGRIRVDSRPFAVQNQSRSQTIIREFAERGNEIYAKA
jgi:hypothetical protein